ncbi:PREDICTED: protein SLOW GREEN 1, chloroplastic-like isoform X1 [Camelina sativa]|uniref:Protein SLOW GREEN 1, chloroplastic-like isoform X1 n=1 Tax=Camelina sativa TaxID=90675 RepID=A0ABM0WNC2_CAMSA|nr:PREDICTED: protein SLOW GREEN 1, chloroplastic-like isoform X1 [Camelina sativa]
MASPSKFQCCMPKYNLQINLVRTAPQNLSFPRLYRDQAKSTPVVVTIRASSSSPSPSNPKRSLLKTTFITLTASAALFLAASSLRFRITKPAATTTPVTTLLETTLEKHLETHSNDAEALISLAKIKFESDKCDEAIEIMNRLIEIEPQEQKWPGMKARILSFFCKKKLAIEAFEEILLTDPIRVDALHYLVMEYYDSKPKLLEAEKRIKYAIRRCKDMKKKKKKTKEIRGLRMLIAQIRVLEGNTVDAIRICEELVNEDPEDHKVYLFQGLVYTLLKKGDEAKKQFEQVARILPENHWYLDTPMDKTEWGAMEAYDNVFCYLATFSRLFVASFFLGKFV